MKMELLAQLLFAIYALIILGGGLVAVFSKSLVRAMVGLVLTLFGVAGLYLLMNAPFIALMQLLIYVGAVVVLIFFALMLTDASIKGDEAVPRTPGKFALALVGCGSPGLLLAHIVYHTPQKVVALPEEITIDLLGKALLQDYVLAFELISVVLFVAMSGAILLGFERRRPR